MELEYAEELKERFLRYVAVSSESDPAAGVVPSSEGQRELAMLLEGELRDMGLERWLIDIDESDSGEQMLHAALYADSHRKEIGEKLHEVSRRLESLAYQTCETVQSYFRK